MQATQTVRWDDYDGRISLAMEGRGDVAGIPCVEGAGSILEKDGIAWQVMFNGLRMKAGGYYGEWMSLLIQKLGGFHEPQEERVFHEVIDRLDAPRSMIELGAYWAWYSLWFKSRFPEAIAIAVEPDPRNLAIAASNAIENHLDLFLELGGVVSHPAKTILEGAFAITPHCHIPVVTVVGLMNKYGLDRLNILHADIQGAELKMLRDAKHLLDEKRIDHIFVSTHGDKIHFDCRSLLCEAGYSIIAEHTSAESYSFDGLIVARSTELPLLEVAITHRGL